MRRVVGPVGSVDVAAPAAVAAAAGFETLEDVLRARYEVLAVVVQDEFTHDVVTRAPAGPGVYVVFDTT